MSLAQPHKNLFVSLSGSPLRRIPTQTPSSRGAREPPKALIYVLEHADRDLVLAPFLREIVALRHVRDVVRVQFALQRRDIRRPHLARRTVLTLAPDATLDCDAWIWSEPEFGVLKVTGRANQAQLHQQVRSAGSTPPSDQSCCKGVFQFFAAAKPRRHQQPAREGARRLHENDQSRDDHDVRPALRHTLWTERSPRWHRLGNVHHALSSRLVAIWGGSVIVVHPAPPTVSL